MPEKTVRRSRPEVQREPQQLVGTLDRGGLGHARHAQIELGKIIEGHARARARLALAARRGRCAGRGSGRRAAYGRLEQCRHRGGIESLCQRLIRGQRAIEQRHADCDQSSRLVPRKAAAARAICGSTGARKLMSTRNRFTPCVAMARTSCGARRVFGKRPGLVMIDVAIGAGRPAA